MLINLTLPVYNEETVLRKNVERLLDFLKNSVGLPDQPLASRRSILLADPLASSCEIGQSLLSSAAAMQRRRLFECEIIIADNASTDRTWRIARQLSQRHPRVKVVHLDEQGRGRALKQAWSDSRADILSYMDIDLSTDLAAFPPLIGSLVGGGYDLAIGSRLLEQSRTTRGFKREMLSRCYNRLIKLLCQTRFSDAQCGFKAITRQAADGLLPRVVDNGWFFDTELLILAEKLGYRVFEFPVRWVDDPDSRVRIWRTAVEDIKGLLRIRRNLANIRSAPVSAQQRQSKCNDPKAERGCSTRKTA